VRPLIGLAGLTPRSASSLASSDAGTTENPCAMSVKPFWTTHSWASVFFT
jgi:hypothetical protein